MKSQFWTGGGRRLFQGQKELKSESIETKYAAAPAHAGPEEQRQIPGRMAEESLRRDKMMNPRPSAGTLW
jgi:hypothetical protein